MVMSETVWPFIGAIRVFKAPAEGGGKDGYIWNVGVGIVRTVI